MRHTVLAWVAMLSGCAMQHSPTERIVPSYDSPTSATLNVSLPTLFIAGDSTAAKGPDPEQEGWGEPLATYFDRSKINIANRARGGRSSRTFITEGHWDKLLAEMKAGDTVIIQFGHNDGGAINEEPPGSKYPLRARGSLPGLGEESAEIDNVLTKKHEVVQTFGWYIRKMIADTRAKGATPIVMSLTVRNEWIDGSVERGPGRYREWDEQIAKQAGIAFIDLTGLIAVEYEKLGPVSIKPFFPKDHTHTNPAGADFNAECAVRGLQKLPNKPFRKYLSERGRTVH